VGVGAGARREATAVSRIELGVSAGFVLGNVFGAVLADTLPQALVGSGAAVAFAIVVIRLAEQVGVVPDL
jgi:hypothetical protein